VVAADLLHGSFTGASSEQLFLRQVKQEMPIHISNVSPVVDGKPSRVRFVTKPDGSKVRVASRGGKELHTLHKARGKAKA
jgi:large subunit ribosomal protein L24